MAGRESPGLFSECGSPVVPVQAAKSAKSFYGTGQKSRNRSGTSSGSTSTRQLRKRSPAILSAKTLPSGAEEKPAESESQAEERSVAWDELPRWCRESQYRYYSPSQSQEETTHSDEQESVSQSQVEVESYSTAQPEWWEISPASQSQNSETPSVSQPKRKGRTVSQAYISDSGSESEFERYSSKRK